MYNKKDIEKTLLEFNYFIDEITLSNFIKKWKIDAIYEDEDGVEFFDNLAIAKLKKGISLKSQGYSNDQIVYHINKILPEQIGFSTDVQPQTAITKTENTSTTVQNNGEMKNITIDVTSQTLQMLADSVAQKITSEISKKVKDSTFAKQFLEDSSLKEKNEELSAKVDELTEDNKKLAKRVAELEKTRSLCPINLEYFKKYFKTNK